MLIRFCQVHRYVCWAPFASAPFIGAAPENFSHFSKPVFCPIVATRFNRVSVRLNSCSNSLQLLFQNAPTDCLFSRHKCGIETHLTFPLRAQSIAAKKRRQEDRPSPPSVLNYNRSCSLPKLLRESPVTATPARQVRPCRLGPSSSSMPCGPGAGGAAFRPACARAASGRVPCRRGRDRAVRSPIARAAVLRGTPAPASTVPASVCCAVPADNAHSPSPVPPAPAATLSICARIAVSLG